MGPWGQATIHVYTLSQKLHSDQCSLHSELHSEYCILNTEHSVEQFWTQSGKTDQKSLPNRNRRDRPG